MERRRRLRFIQRRGKQNSFFKQFYGSVTKSDYSAMRHGFIMTHCRGNLKLNFHKYMIRALEDDFRHVVGISWYLWLFVMIFLLLNVNGWHTYFLFQPRMEADLYIYVGWCRASDFPRDYDGACLQMRLSYSPCAYLFLFLVQWTDCNLAGALGLLRILIYEAYDNGKTTMAIYERKTSLREFYGEHALIVSIAC